MRESIDPRAASNTVGLMPHWLRTLIAAFGGLSLLLYAFTRWTDRKPSVLVRSTVQNLGRLGRRRPIIAWLVIWAVAAVPMLYLTYLVLHYGVNVPTLDDWEMAPLIVKAKKGTLVFADVFSQQQEGRTVLPKLIFIFSALGGQWDVRRLMILSVLCCWLITGGIFLLLRRTSRLPLPAVALCLWLSVLAVFTPAQFELWLFASGLPSFLPALFIVSALVVLESNVSPGWKFGLCVLLSFSSSFTLPHGLLAWILTFPVWLVTERIRRWPLWLLAWIAVAAGCLVIYFWGYAKPDYLPHFAPPIPQLEYLRFILIFLGGGLAYSCKTQPVIAAMSFGCVQAFLLAIVTAYTIVHIRDRAFVRRSAPWFALAAYSLGSACLAALGRIEYGAPYALASRYVTFSLYLTVALIALYALMFVEVCRSSTTRSVIASLVTLAICVSYLFAYKVASANTLYFLRGYSAKDRLAHGAIVFSQVIDTSEVISKIIYPPDASRVVRDAANLDTLGLLRPPLLRNVDVQSLSHADADGKTVDGKCESVTLSQDGRIHAAGWAALVTKRRQADCVALAYEAEGGEPVLFAMSQTIEARPDLARRLRSEDVLWSGWTATYPRDAVPRGAKVLFWAVDADGPMLYRLPDNSAVQSD